ncbi:unnamed protein product [Brassica oleracea]|uniref:Uncharacterized protein n=1 Tax=Brassica oleracea TaxID=3712 RepID=A0A3P6EA34_BRAOL|nr:unnamed protein product [Brassica oleracea]
MSPSPLLGAVSSLIQCSHYSFSIQMDPFPVKFAATDLNGRLRGTGCQCILTRWASARSEEFWKRERQNQRAN